MANPSQIRESALFRPSAWPASHNANIYGQNRNAKIALRAISEGHCIPRRGGRFGRIQAELLTS